MNLFPQPCGHLFTCHDDKQIAYWLINLRIDFKKVVLVLAFCKIKHHSSDGFPVLLFPITESLF